MPVSFAAIPQGGVCGPHGGVPGLCFSHRPLHLKLSSSVLGVSAVRGLIAGGSSAEPPRGVLWAVHGVSECLALEEGAGCWEA